MPVVDTLKSKYAIISGVGALYDEINFFFGKSSVGNIGGQDLGSITVCASFDFNNFNKDVDDKIATDLLTCTIIFTVGNVVVTLCGLGGRTGTGIRPEI